MGWRLTVEAVMGRHNYTLAPVATYQDTDEINRLIEIYRGLAPKRVLEIGSLYGGTLYNWMRYSHGSVVVSVDLVVAYYDHRFGDITRARGDWQNWARTFNCQLIDLAGDSRSERIIDKVSEYAPFDFAFIDGDHTLDGIRADFAHYFPMLRPGGIMAVHDICYPAVNVDRIDVGEWWRNEIVGKYRTEEIIAEPGRNYWGIGLIYA
jgi:predicted O-methyltransferase YrrM